MVTLLKKELEFEKGIKKKFDIIGSFIGCKPEFINGSIKTIDKTNITYVEPHRIIYKGITFLYFNFTNEVYIKSLDKKIKISEIEDYIKSI